MSNTDLIVQEFDYSLVNSQIAEFLKQKAIAMSDIVGKAYTDLGKELKESQDELSNRGYGCFEEWYTSLGFKRQTVYKLIARFEMMTLHNMEEQKLLEDLPLSLSYEVSKRSANPELKQQVLAGDIKTLKEYKDLESKLKEAERERERLEKLNSLQQQDLNKERVKQQEAVTKADNEKYHYEKLWKIERDKPSHVKIETIFEPPSDYEDLKQQAVRGQELNSENVKLQRKNQELTQQLAENKTDEITLRKIRNQYVTIMQELTGNHTRMVLELQTIQGKPDTTKFAEEYREQLNSFYRTAYKDLDELTEIRQTKPENGGIGIEYTIDSN